MKKRRILLLLIIVSLPTPSTAGSISLPQTGQTRCYDTTGGEIACAETGQDGDVRAGVAWPSPRFTVSGDCITDRLAGLMWGRNANLPGNMLTWQVALDYATGLTLCGHSDWRLPNINEMESLLNGDEPDNSAWLKNQGFTLVESSNTYWSSTSHAYDPDSAWDILMAYGNIGRTRYYYSSFGWHVRGESSGPTQLWKTGQVMSYANGDDGHLQKGVAWPSPRFTVRYDCVTDNLTGLMWPHDANLPGDRLTWQAALDYANDLTLCGYSEWRLPNRKELMSLIDRSRSTPALPADHPFANLQLIYWSSTTSPSYPDNASAVDMELGGTGAYYKYQTNSVWPVREASFTSDFVYPVLGISQTDPFRNKQNPLKDGWAGHGVGDYGAASGHLGQDYYLRRKNSAGKPVFAVADGKIVEVLKGPGKHGWCDKRDHGWGPVVVIKHEVPGGFTVTPSALKDPGNCGTNALPRVIYSLYGHLSKKSIKGLKVGRPVVMGQKIGTIGAYGIDQTKWRTNHLHFELKDEIGFKEGSWYTNHRGQCPGAARQACDARGVGTAYSFKRGFAPHRYVPSIFINDNMTQ